MQTRAAALCRLLAPRPDPRDDGDLLTAFVRTGDEAAFGELIRRHGPLVLSACRRLLPDPADAEDAFQSAFVVLIRRASRLNSLPSLGPWLYRVAVFTARNIRRRNARRFAKQSVLPDSVAVRSTLNDVELRLDLDDALLRLPEKLRTPIVLCHLQGWTRRDAAERLGCPEGTLSSLLARGLAKLRRRLSGFDPAKMLVMPSIVIPTVLTTSTVRAAATAIASTAFFPTFSTLAEGVVRMFWIKKTTAASMALAVVFGLGVSIGVSVRQAPYAGAAGTPGATLVEMPVTEPPSTAEDLARALEAALIAEDDQQLQEMLQKAQADLEIAEAARKLATAQLELAKQSGKPDATAEAAAKLAQAQAQQERAVRSLEVLRAKKEELAKTAKSQRLTETYKKLKNDEIEKLLRDLEAANDEYVAARKALDAARERLELLKLYVKDIKELKPEADKVADTEKKMLSALDKVRLVQKQLAARSEDEARKKEAEARRDAERQTQDLANRLALAKAELERAMKLGTPAAIEKVRAEIADLEAALARAKAVQPPESDKQLAETKALLEELRAQRARLEADLRKLQRSAQDLDAKSEAVQEQLKMLELKKAKEAKEKEKPILPPLPAAGGGGGAAFVVTIYEENPNFVCTLTEIAANGKLVGTLTCDNADILRVTLARATKDQAAPKELRVAVKANAKYNVVVAVLDACKAAGFKDVKISSLFEKKVPITSSGALPALPYRTVTDLIEEETTTIDRYLEKIAKP